MGGQVSEQVGEQVGEQDEWILTMNPEKLEYYSKSQEELDMLGTELWQSASMKEENIHTPFSLKADFERAVWRMTDSDGNLIMVL